VRDASGRILRMEVEGPIPAPPAQEGQDPIVAHTAAVTAVLERHIRRHPGQWLWLHRRWKVQPPTEPLAPGGKERG
jgi:Kdo2-lipid IVA lauroyltransferase/acyltransferase